MTLFNGLIESLQRFVFCLSTKTEKFTEQERSEIDQTESFTGPECVTEKWRERVMKEPSTDEEKRKMTSSDDIRILFSVAEPLAVKEASHPPTPTPVTEIRPLPSVREPVMVNTSPPTSTLQAGKTRPKFRPLPSVREPTRGNKNSQRSRPSAGEIRPLPSVLQEVQVPQNLTLQAGEIRPLRVQRTSRHLRRAAVEIKPLPLVEEPSLADRIFQLIPPADRIKEPILVHQNPTSAAVIQKPIDQVDPTCAELNPQPATSPFDSTPQLVLMDTDIECEYVKNTGKTISPGEMKTKQHQPLEAAMKPKRIICWMENDSEVQEPVPPVQMVEVQAFTVEDEENSGKKKFDSRRITNDASRKGFEERVIRLFHVNPSYRPETQRRSGQKKPWNKSNSSLFLLDWAEKTVRKTEEKRKRKESEKLQRQLLHNRYQNDPKLRHLIINKHNRFYNSFCNIDFSFTV